MDPLTATIVTILTIVIVFIAAMLAIRGKTNNQISLLTERLTQISEYQATSLNQLSQKFQEQERALTKSIDERLSATSIRVSETLEKNINIQKTSLDDLKERLVRIDTAQKNIFRRKFWILYRILPYKSFKIALKTPPNRTNISYKSM